MFCITITSSITDLLNMAREHRTSKERIFMSVSEIPASKTDGRPFPKRLENNPLNYLGRPGADETSSCQGSDDGGFTPVTRRRSARINNPTISPIQPASQSGKSYQGRNLLSNRGHSNQAVPPSAAASLRHAQYHNLGKGSNYYKQSALPVEERDPVSEEIEKNRGIKLEKEKFKPGMIIRAGIYEQDYRGDKGVSEATLADRYRSETRYGAVYTKFRKMIVISLLHGHYVAL